MNTATSIFQFLSTPAGQQLVATGGEELVAAIAGLIKLFHKASVATPEPAPKAQ